MYVSETELSKTINALVRSTRYLLLVVRIDDSRSPPQRIILQHDIQSNRVRFGVARLYLSSV